MHSSQPPHASCRAESAPAGLALAHARQAHARAQALSAQQALGLRGALAQAPLVVVCAVGADLEAALMARACYSRVAQLPVLVLHPHELVAMGAGLWRLTQLLVVSYGDGAGAQAVAACHEAVRLARAVHCPILALLSDGAVQLPEAALGRGPWRLPTEGQPAASHGAFALPYLGHLALAAAAARARLPEFVAAPEAKTQAVTELTQGLQAYSACAEAQLEQWATSGALLELAARCGPCPHVRLTTAQWQLLPALRALAAFRTYVDVSFDAEPAGPCPEGTLQLRLTADARDLRVWTDDAPEGTAELPLPTSHEALGGLWAHLVLGLLLPVR